MPGVWSHWAPRRHPAGTGLHTFSGCSRAGEGGTLWQDRRAEVYRVLPGSQHCQAGDPAPCAQRVWGQKLSEGSVVDALHGVAEPEWQTQGMLTCVIGILKSNFFWKKFLLASRLIHLRRSSEIRCFCLPVCVYDYRNPIDSKHRKFH